jgi:glycosyltransferase involved in cell wall biosynthesis
LSSAGDPARDTLRPSEVGTRGAKTPGAASPVGYLLKCFPRLSETFILNEVLELERQGVDLRVYSLNEPQEPVTHRLAARVRSPIAYLPYPLLRHAHRYALAHLALLARHPLGYLRTLATVLFALDGDLLERFVQAGFLAGLLQRDGVRHVHAGFVHYPGSVAWLVHRITGRTFSLATHAKDMVHSPPELLRRKLAEAEVVFTCTQFNVPALKERAGPAGLRRLRRIYHGADLARFPYAPGPPLDPPLVLAVGRLVEKKGLDHLISACRLLRERGRRFQCRIVAGSRDLWDELTAQILALDLAEHVVLAGPLDQDEVRRWYRSASVFALPCVVAEDGDRDGIPNVLVEAAATGAPLVSTAVGGIPELVRDGETGLVVPPRDPAALAHAIERLLDSPELATRLREGGRARVEECFDLSRNAVHVAREFALLAGVGASPAPDDLETMEQGAS